MKLNINLPKIKSRISSLRLPTLPLDLKKIESFDNDHYRVIAYGLGTVIVIMVVAGLSAFFLTLRGAEQTMVPDVRGMELAQALVRMQEKELYPRISLRFTDDPGERGTVVEQSPSSGAIVKAGRRVQLTVSRGAVADKVENYVGQDVNEVKIHLQTVFAGSRPLLSIKEPIAYVFDRSPAGTILEQKPAPGAEIGGPTALELWVSRGPEKAQIRMPDLSGISMEDALLQVEKEDLVVSFSMRKAVKGERQGAVASQTPAPGSMIAASSRVSVTVTEPASAKGMVAGVYKCSLPEYPYPLRVSLEALGPSGDRSPILTVEHPGGIFSAPYFLSAGSFLVLTVLDREVPPRVEIRAPE
jgi:beta-lactam-binding protein with PASTA domain